VPVARIACQFGTNERAMLDDARQCLSEMIDAVGGRIEHVTESLPGQIVHEVGGARMGNHPRSSVVDDVCRLWDVEMALTVRAARAAVAQVNP
jgi:choline dehydrogenase-like flavoprotein